MDLEQIIAPAKERRDELEQELERIKAEELAPRQEEVRALTRVINAANPQSKPGRPSKSDGPPRVRSSLARNDLTPNEYPRPGTKVAAVTAGLVKALMTTKVGDEIRTKDLRDIAGYDRSFTSDGARAMEVMRSDGLIRFVRQEGNSKWYTRTGDTPSPALQELVKAES